MNVILASNNKTFIRNISELIYEAFRDIKVDVLSGEKFNLPNQDIRSILVIDVTDNYLSESCVLELIDNQCSILLVSEVNRDKYDDLLGQGLVNYIFPTPLALGEFRVALESLINKLIAHKSIEIVTPSQLKITLRYSYYGGTMVWGDNNQIIFTSIETQILENLLKNFNSEVLKIDIINQIWQYQQAERLHLLDIHIANIRKKFKKMKLNIDIRCNNQHYIALFS